VIRNPLVVITKMAKRQRITRPIRLRGGFASRDSTHHERPREEWIEIAVPPIVTEETFALTNTDGSRNGHNV
jgi:site-specific DNA recombinase